MSGWGHCEKRDVLPVTPPVVRRVDRDVRLSRGARERLHRNEKIFQGVADSLETLNETYGVMSDGLHPSSPLQEDCVRQVVKAHKDFAPPPELLTRQEAATELLHFGLGYTTSTFTAVESFDYSRLSFPYGQDKPVECSNVLSSSDADVLRNYSKDVMLSAEEWAGVVDRLDPLEAYWSPVLKFIKSKCIHFIAELYHSSMIIWRRSVRETVGLFVVKKKQNRQRLICDARRANRRFKIPPSIKLCTAAGLSELCSVDDSQFYCAQADVKDYFYRLTLPESMCDLFGFRPIYVKDLMGIPGGLPSELAGYDALDVVYPCLSVWFLRVSVGHFG